MASSQSNSKVWVIVGIIVVIVAIVIGVVMYKKSMKEKFVYVPRSFYFENEYGNNGYGYSMPNPKVPLTDVLSSDRFMSRPSLKPYLSPRIPPIQFSSELRGPVPPEYMQSVPRKPIGDDKDLIDFTKYMGKVETIPEEFSQMTQGEIEMKIKEKFNAPLEYNDPSEILPGEDMASIKFGKLASDPNTYIYDRLIYANQRRRNLYGADFIRGDLPIVPINHSDGESSWFQPSIKPHLDLRKSAMRYIGPEYDTIVDMEDLMVNSKFEQRAPKVVAFD